MFTIHKSTFYIHSHNKIRLLFLVITSNMRSKIVLSANISLKDKVNVARSSITKSSNFKLYALKVANAEEHLVVRSNLLNKHYHVKPYINTIRTKS